MLKQPYQKYQMKKHKNKKTSIAAVALCTGIILLTATSLANQMYKTESEIERLSYTEYTKLLDDGKIDKVLYNDNDDYMTVVMYNEKTRSLTE